MNVLVSSEPEFDNTPEFLITEIKYQNVKILCAVVYRRPEASSPFHFFSCLSAHLPHYNNVIITGDFNANVDNPTHTDSKILLNQIDSNALSVVSCELTHHLFDKNPPSHTTLDLFIVNDLKLVSSFTKSDSPFIAGHDFIELSFHCNNPKPTSKIILTRSLQTSDPIKITHAFHEALHSTPLTTSLLDTTHTFNSPSPLTVDSYERALSQAIISAFDSAAPLRSVKLSSKRQPWVSPAIRALMRKRDLAYKTSL